MSGLTGAWPLLFLPVLWWFAPWGRAKRHPVGVVDLALALGLGVAVALVAGGWLADFHTTGGRFTTSDFGRYCGNLSAMHHGRWEDWHLASSLLPGWLLSPLLTTLGVVDTLALGGLMGCGAVAAGVYLWAAALHSRSAGVAAALFTLALAPLVLLSRNLTFYPVQVAVYTLATALAVLAMSRRTPLTLVLGGVGVGLALLVDVRGLLVAAPALLMLTLAALRGPATDAWRWAPIRMALVLLPLVGSWWLAPRAFPTGAKSLEHHVLALDVRKVAAQRLGRAPHVPSTHFVWGQTPPLEIPATLLELQRTGASLQPATRDLPMNREGRSLHLRPWLAPTLMAVAVTGWALRRRPWALLTLLLSVLPAAATVNSAANIELRLRFLAPAAPALAVVLGVAFTTLLQAPRIHRLEQLPRPPWPARELLAMLGLTALLMGVPPSWLSPLAPRVVPAAAGQAGRALDQAVTSSWSTDPQVRDAQLKQLGQSIGEAHTPGWEVCQAQLAEDLEAGHSPGGTLLRR